MIYESIPQTTRDVRKVNKPAHDVRLLVNLLGIEREGSQSYVLRLGYGRMCFDICVIPLLGLCTKQASRYSVSPTDKPRSKIRDQSHRDIFQYSFGTVIDACKFVASDFYGGA